MRQISLLLFCIFVPFLSFSQDLNGIWKGTGTQQIGKKTFKYTIEAFFKQEKNDISGQMVTFETGTQNHKIVNFRGTVKNGKIKIYPEKIVKIDYPKTNFDFVCIRHFKGDIKVDEENNVLIIDLESYGIDAKYELLTKTLSDGTCPPSYYRLTRKLPVVENSITTTAAGNKEIKLSTKNVKIKIWDRHEEDGDLINLYLNGEILFANLEVTKKGQIFDIELLSGINTIEVEAINEGKISPNTSSIRIFTDDLQHDIFMRANTGGKDTLKIILE